MRVQKGWSLYSLFSSTLIIVVLSISLASISRAVSIPLIKIGYWTLFIGWWKVPNTSFIDIANSIWIKAKSVKDSMSEHRPQVISTPNSHWRLDDLAFANDFAEDKSKTTFHRILVEQILPTFMEKDDALVLLEEHVTNNILKVLVPFDHRAYRRWASSSIDKRLGFLKDLSCQLFSAISSTRIWKRKNCLSWPIPRAFYCD